MSDTTTVKTNVQSAVTEEGVETTETTAPGSEEGDIDYATELASALDAQEKAEKERDNYKRGLLKAKGKAPAEEDEEDEVSRRVKEELSKILPSLQASLVQDNVETVLREISGDENEQKLIKYHFENSVGMNGTIRERLENAKLIANKKVLLKKQKELGIALKNRQQFSGSGFGSNSQSIDTVQDRVLSAEQIAGLKKRGWDDKKIQRFKQNLAKNRVL